MFSVAAHADTVDGGYVEKDDVRAVQYEFMLSKGGFSDNGYVDVYLYIPKYLDMQSNEFNMSIYNDEPIISIGNEFVDRVEYFISKDDVESFSGSNIEKLNYMPIKYEGKRAESIANGEKINTKEIKILKVRIYFKDFSAKKKFAIMVPVVADLDNEFEDTLPKNSYVKTIVKAKEKINIIGKDLDIKFNTTPVKLSFDLDGGQGDIKPQIVAKGDKAKEVEKVTKNDFVFSGWYDGENKFDFSKKITKDTILKARWEKLYNVLIKYIDKEGNILKEIRLRGKLGEEYIANEEKIDGYKISLKPKNEKGVFTKDSQELIYVYEKEDKDKEDKDKDKEDKTTTVRPGSGGGNSSYKEINKSEVFRVSGRDRVETAVEFSKENFSKSKYVIVTDGKNFADPLVSTTLAAKLRAPILLTVDENIEEVVADEIKRLESKEIIIVGGPKSVSDSKKDQLRKFDKNGVERIYGHNRYDTSINLAEKLISEFDMIKEKAIIASGEVFADVLSVSPYSVKINRPILLTSVDKLPESVNKYIEDRKLDEILLIGGESTISHKLKDTIDNKVKESKRIAGSNRYETSVLIANEGFKNDESIYITSGEIFADGLVSGAASFKGEEKAVILTREKSLLDVTRNYIKDSNTRNITIVGGVDRVGKDIERELKNIIIAK